ncbi:MAG: hypothetical protein VW547_03385 [Alphaproteobacteria bacterium]
MNAGSAAVLSEEHRRIAEKAAKRYGKTKYPTFDDIISTATPTYAGKCASSTRADIELWHEMAEYALTKAPLWRCIVCGNRFSRERHSATCHPNCAMVWSRRRSYKMNSEMLFDIVTAYESGKSIRDTAEAVMVSLATARAVLRMCKVEIR